MTDTKRCPGLNRFGQRCGNRISTDKDSCGQCVGPPTPTPRTAPDPDSRPTTGPDPWTPAGTLEERLVALTAGNPQLQELARVATQLAAASRAQSTRDTYDTHWRTFTKFCDLVALPSTLPVPADTVVLFIAYMANVGRINPATGARDSAADLAPLTHGYLRQAISAIGRRHDQHGSPSPTLDPAVSAVLVGYGKTHGTKTNGSDPLHGHQIQTICAHIAAANTSRVRDKALILLVAGEHLTAGQAVALEGQHVLWPDNTGDPVVLAAQRRRSANGMDLVELPAGLPAWQCPSAALRSLHIDPYGPVFRTSSGERMTRQAAMKAIATATSAVGISAKATRVPDLTAAELATVASALDSAPWRDLRDQTILTLLYGATLRGSELSDLTWADIRTVEAGVEVTIARAKNDPHGKGHTTGAPRKSDPVHCPATRIELLRAAYTDLLGRVPHDHEPVIATIVDRALAPITRERISQIVTERAAAARIKGRYTSHSPRSGSATDMLDNGAPMAQVIKHGRWETEKSVHGYYKRTQLWGPLNPAQALPDSAS